MYAGARVTDAVTFHRHRGELKAAVRIVRFREPERLRWRTAVMGVNASTGTLLGRPRMMVEEPIREIVLDLSDLELRREVVLDARRVGVDLDRGEILPFRTMGDLRRMAFLTQTDLSWVARHVALPTDFEAPVDTAAVALVGRAFAEHHRRRAQRLWLELPDPEGPVRPTLHHELLAERAELDHDLSRRWTALSRAVVTGR